MQMYIKHWTLKCDSDRFARNEDVKSRDGLRLDHINLDDIPVLICKKRKK